MARVTLDPEENPSMKMSDMPCNSWAKLNSAYLAYRDGRGRFYQVTILTGEFSRFAEDETGERMSIEPLKAKSITFWL